MSIRNIILACVALAACGQSAQQPSAQSAAPPAAEQSYLQSNAASESLAPEVREQIVSHLMEAFVRCSDGFHYIANERSEGKVLALRVTQIEEQPLERGAEQIIHVLVVGEQPQSRPLGEVRWSGWSEPTCEYRFERRGADWTRPQVFCRWMALPRTSDPLPPVTCPAP